MSYYGREFQPHTCNVIEETSSFVNYDRIRQSSTRKCLRGNLKSVIILILQRLGILQILILTTQSGRLQNNALTIFRIGLFEATHQWQRGQRLVTLAFGNFFERSYHNLNITRPFYFIAKATFPGWWSWFKFSNSGLVLGMACLEILYECGKRVKTKSWQAFTANSYVCRS